MRLRAYQKKAVADVQRCWASSVKSVLLVAPTGAGKTLLGAHLVSGYSSVLWVAHRRELVAQAAGRLGATFGRDAIGVTMPGGLARRGARIQVGTIQSFLASKKLPHVDVLVLDEAHHYVAEEWNTLRARVLVGQQGDALTLGLTATPQRGDGTPLGNIFDALVVAASYTELVCDGFLVPASVLQPSEDLGNDLAQDPVAAWAKYSGGAPSFVCCARVAIAGAVAKRFRDHGVLAELISAETPRRERDEIMVRFRSGKTRVLTYVDTLTEGVDVPEARCIVLAKGFKTVGAYIQTVGRVLRPAPGKTHAVVVDLVGGTLLHGLPTDDRIYSLDGKPISGEGTPPPNHGPAHFLQEVRGVDLAMVGWTPPTPPKPVALAKVDEKIRRAEYRRLLALVRKHKMRDGFAAAKYREKYGEEPRREWS